MNRYMIITPVRVEDGIMYCGEPVECNSVEEVGLLPFINKFFKDGQTEIYFRWIEELQAHAVVMDPELDDDTTVVALAQFISTNFHDTDAVDSQTIH